MNRRIVCGLAVGLLAAVAPVYAQNAYTDAFDRATLGPDWAVENGNFDITANRLRQSSGLRYTNARLRHVGGDTAGIDQYAKLRVASLGTHTWGFMFRVNGAASDHYQVHPPTGTFEWRWERHDPTFVRRIDDCTGDAPVSANDWIGATVEGVGNGTVVRVWRWSTDPDLGGAVDVAANWGPADCTMTADPVSPVDAGLGLGIRAYTGSSTANASADDWAGGDLPPPPVCGDSVVEGAEQCDDGNTTDGDGCDASCVSEVCGNGVLQVGEECDDGNLVAGDGCDASCVAEPPPPVRAFSDDFNRASLGPNWAIGSGDFDIATNRLRQDSGTRFLNARLRYAADTTATPRQYSKLQIVSPASHTWGFMMRVAGPASDHYQVHLTNGSNEWRWERHDPAFVRRIDQCFGTGTPAAGSWIGATVDGSGNDTVVRVWLWSSDPDVGGAVDVDGNWGAPACTMTADPVSPVDAATGLGIRAYTGSSTANATVDNWSGGDLPLPTVCGDSVVEGTEQCDDGNTADGDGCDSMCVNEVCGNGVLQVGEECDDGNLVAGDGCDASCVAEPPPPVRAFADDFNRVALGPDWVTETGLFGVSTNRLRQNSGTRFLNARLRYAADTTATPRQYSKLQIVSPASHTWGFMMRVAGPASDHYQIHLTNGSNEWRWERHDPAFVRRIDQCFGPGTAAAGDWIGATVDGSGNDTIVRVWLWSSDPDVGGAVDVDGNWGAPACTMTADPVSPLDAATGLGIRAYTGTSTASGTADNWSGGDLPLPAVCGDGAVEGSEQCDDGNTTDGDGCDATCVLEVCGNGVLQSGEQCEVDGDCLPSEVCDGGCNCIPAPVCGDGSVDAGEECDDGNTANGDGCDASCVSEVCGNGVVQSGEQCDDGNLVGGDGCDASCMLEPVTGRSFQDDFDRGSLGPDWTVDSLSFDLSFDQLRSDSGITFANGRLRWTDAATDTADQYGKLEVVTQGTQTWGFVFRSGPTDGDHYQVHSPVGGNEWRWERHDPGFVERIDDCVGNGGVTDGDWIGASVEGTGDDTVVRVWRWGSDPDGGGPVDIAANWGAPACIMTDNPASPVDAGAYVGIRTYTGGSNSSARADNWFAGDCGPAVDQISCGASMAGEPRILEIFDSSGAGTPDSLLDPDGVAFDSAGNVFTAACGLGPDSEGVFMRTPGGVITEVIDDLGDGAGNPLSCPVGLVVDGADTLYTVGFLSDNAFRRTAGGTITEIIDETGDGAGNTLWGTLGIAVDGGGNVFVTGHFSDNAFRIEPNGTVTEIIDAGGDGVNGLDGPFGIAVDSVGNVYVAGFLSDNVFRIEPNGTVTRIMDASGDDLGNPLMGPHDITVGPDDSIYLTGNTSDNVFRIFPNGSIRQILSSAGDGKGNVLDNPTGIAVGPSGKVYVAAFGSENAFEITPGGGVTQLIDSTGDGVTGFNEASDFCVAVDEGAGEVYLASTGTNSVFRVLLTCGDGNVDPVLETCDDAGPSAACDDDCTAPVCGDGNVNAAAGEQCEFDADCGGGQTCAGCTCI